MSTIQENRYQVWGAIAKVLHNILHQYPEMSLIDSFKQNELAEIWPQLENSEYELQGQTFLNNYLNHWDSTPEQLVELKVDYGMLFFGPGDPKAAPWGSVYTGEEQSLNGASTQKLIAFYREHNLELAIKTHEPVDHIGLIFLVLEYLLNELAKNPEDTHKLRICTLLLQNHLMPWADRCLELAELHSETEFYKGIAILSRIYLKQLCMDFNVINQNIRLFR